LVPVLNLYTAISRTAPHRTALWGGQATLSKLKTLVKKYEMSRDRIRQRIGPLASSGGGGGGGLDGVDQRYIPASASVAEAASKRRAAATDDVDAIDDNELKEVVLEHQGLQQLRRSLVDRIRRAKDAGADAVAAARKAEADTKALRARVAILAPYIAPVSRGAPSAEEQELKVRLCMVVMVVVMVMVVVVVVSRALVVTPFLVPFFRCFLTACATRSWTSTAPRRPQNTRYGPCGEGFFETSRWPPASAPPYVALCSVGHTTHCHSDPLSSHPTPLH
jgi:hypothetical protein